MMKPHLRQGRYLGVALIWAALAASPGCNDDGNPASVVLDSDPEPEPDPIPVYVPVPSPITGSTLHRTTDGGATWTTSMLPFWVNASTLKCFDDQTGWLKSGNSVYTTSDGGATWQEKLHAGSGTLGAFDAVSTDLAWATLRRPDSKTSEILRTTDGGATWTLSALKHGTVSSLDFVDGSSGWYIADSILFRTSDGGATWTPQREPEMPGGPWVYQGVSRHAFVNPTTGWVAVFAGIYFGGSGGCIMKYTDGTWEIPLVSGSSFGRGLSACDGDHAWAVNNSGLFRTQDGGATWSNLGMPPHYGGNFLQFIDPSNGWMIHEKELWSSSDGGESWTVRLTLTTPGWNFRCHSLVDATTVWLVD